MRLEEFYERTNFQIRYVDYQEGQFTAPCKLTKERAEKFLNDYSVVEVKLTSNNFFPLIAGKSHIKELILTLKDLNP